MNQQQIEVLDFLLDDHFALWDFADTFPQHRPDAHESATGELLDLVRSGHLALSYGKWQDNETALVAPDLASRLLNDPANWLPTGNEPGYALVLTTLGREHLRSLGIGPSSS